MPTGTEDYYRARANEYDAVYNKPERQRDLGILRSRLAHQLTGRHVLEIAAGTGYWTDGYADAAASVMATDVNDATLDVARHRRAWPATVRFAVADGFDLGVIDGPVDAGFVGFFWSHVRRDGLAAFLSGVADRIEAGGRVVFLDNRYVEGSNHPIARTDSDGNTYQQRKLADGASWEVLKNFPSPEQVRDSLGPRFSNAAVEELGYFWCATCTVR
jgi:SAM-dependent methyltransferase